MTPPASNPFSTRFTSPGRIEPLDSSGRRLDLGLLVDRLQRLGGTAAIVGPHGSGKSTLLAGLAGEIAGRGGRLQRVRLRSWRDTPSALTAILRMAPGGTVCFDSWECLGAPGCGLARAVARVAGCGLLVTAHRTGGLPVLVRCDTGVALLRGIVAALPGHDRWWGTLVRAADIDAAFADHGGDLREALSSLYDTFELRSRGDDRGAAAGSADGAGSAGGRREIHESASGFSYAGAPSRNLGFGEC
jgi:energy-coupling factor transporter ATP-binding protein EcfA2